jgi:Uncharacterised protein family (UPF0236)
LQRVITDFGADHAFGLVPKKLQEHYGIGLSASTVRAITEYHAGQIYQAQELITDQPKADGCKILIGEIDGSMIPIVKVDEEAEDKRKNKTLHWKEARLCLVHEAGSTTPTFGATFSGTVADAGQQLYHCAVQAGFGKRTHLHAVGDGATWIADQIDEQFGAQGSYLIDFYHICDYLAAAAKSCQPKNEKAWMDQQKTRLKQNDYPDILEELDAFLEADTIELQNTPVRVCYRYIKNRPDQLDYKAALIQGLPIGSGEIESAHRYVIQQRLKLPGAWWAPDNVDSMLALRIIRANNQWDEYWNQKRQAA